MSAGRAGAQIRPTILYLRKNMKRRLRSTLTNALIFVLLMAAFTFTMFTAGYTAEKYGPKTRLDVESRCINSACDTPCDQVKKFKRHQGCSTGDSDE